MGRFDGKVVVVTGGGNGIGRACGLRFAGEGGAVVLGDVQEERAAAVAAEIVAAGGQATSLRLDAASGPDNEALAALAVERFGGIDVLVTAAGISHGAYRSGDLDNEVKAALRGIENIERPWQSVFDQERDEWQNVLDVNLTGTLLAVQACGSRMVDRGGAIVTIASIAAKDPDAGPLAYTVSKAGVWMLTKKLARMLAGVGIRVNAIGPGFIDTNMTQIIQMLPPDRREQLNARIPMARVGQPSEIASVAAFLASEDASYMTGEILHPDGGWFTE
jgi:NAD(P)-dependent dehydrogenase (short-subunit alcohol dehydrogenase family)